MIIKKRMECYEHGQKHYKQGYIIAYKHRKKHH